MPNDWARGHLQLNMKLHCIIKLRFFFELVRQITSIILVSPVCFSSCGFIDCVIRQLAAVESELHGTAGLIWLTPTVRIVCHLVSIGAAG